MSKALRTFATVVRGKTPSSKRWLQRQSSDPFVKQARLEQYRSRAAFKLLEIDERLGGFLKPKSVVVDLGAAPGGWTQVAARKVQADVNKPQYGLVLGVDILEIEPIPGAKLLQLDMTDPKALETVKAAIAPHSHASIVLSDMAPSFSGNFVVDEAKHSDLVQSAINLAEQLLQPQSGVLVLKMLQGNDEQAFFKSLQSRFKNVRRIKPKASRDESRETYIVAEKFVK